MKIKLIKFTSEDSILDCLRSLQSKLQKLKFTAYNGFNFENSFLNTALKTQIENDIEYLQILRMKYVRG